MKVISPCVSLKNVRLHQIISFGMRKGLLSTGSVHVLATSKNDFRHTRMNQVCLVNNIYFTLKLNA